MLLHEIGLRKVEKYPVIGSIRPLLNAKIVYFCYKSKVLGKKSDYYAYFCG